MRRIEGEAAGSAPPAASSSTGGGSGSSPAGGGGAAAAAAAAGGGRRFGRGRFGGGSRCRGFDGKNRLADRDFVAHRDDDFCDLAGGGGGHRRDGLAGFQFDDALAFGDGIALFDQDAHDIAGVSAFPERRQFQIHRIVATGLR